MLRDPASIRRRLAFALQVIRASERLLQEAADECGGELRDYFLRHMEEETDHAKWLEEDLGGFSIPLDAVAVAMAGSQYYLIKHVHPSCLLGYMLALEDPMPTDELLELESIHGKALLRTLRLHAEADVGHRKELLAQIAKQPADLQALIESNAQQTRRYISSHVDADRQEKGN
jgi:hypothetical protein